MWAQNDPAGAINDSEPPPKSNTDVKKFNKRKRKNADKEENSNAERTVVHVKENGTNWLGWTGTAGGLYLIGEAIKKMGDTTENNSGGGDINNGDGEQDNSKEENTG